jgi:hypothetical protein
MGLASLQGYHILRRMVVGATYEIFECYWRILGYCEVEDGAAIR